MSDEIKNEEIVYDDGKNEEVKDEKVNEVVNDKKIERFWKKIKKPSKGMEKIIAVALVGIICFALGVGTGIKVSKHNLKGELVGQKNIQTFYGRNSKGQMRNGVNRNNGNFNNQRGQMNQPQQNNNANNNNNNSNSQNIPANNNQNNIN